MSPAAPGQDLRLLAQLDARRAVGVQESEQALEDAAERKSQLVFIGRKLDREELNAGFRRCLA